MERIIKDFLASGNAFNHLSGGPNNIRKASFVWNKTLLSKYNPPRFQGGKGRQRGKGHPGRFVPQVMPRMYM